MTDAETRFAIDAVTALRIVREDPTLGARRPLVAPVALRGDVLSMLYREVRAGVLDERDARAQLERLAALKVRTLGDRVSRATAFRLARRQDAEDTRIAEYLAVALLQADVLVAGDERIAAAATGIVPLVEYGDLLA